MAGLEKQAYEWQLKIYDVRIDIFTEEELRIRTKIDAIKQEIAGGVTVSCHYWSSCYK